MFEHRESAIAKSAPAAAENHVFSMDLMKPLNGQDKAPISLQKGSESNQNIGPISDSNRGNNSDANSKQHKDGTIDFNAHPLKGCEAPKHLDPVPGSDLPKGGAGSVQQPKAEAPAQPKDSPFLPFDPKHLQRT